MVIIMNINENHEPYVAFDLDGTLAEFDYDKWQSDKTYIGKPILRMVELVKEYIARGTVVKIFTARADSKENISVIHKWLIDNGLPELEVTNKKDYDMTRLYDDSCVQVFTNQGVMHNDVLNTIIKPVVGKNKSEILKRMDKLSNSSIEGRALAEVLSRLFRFMDW